METGTTLSRYTIVSRLGAGGMGEVYRARDPDLEREVALKVLPQRLAENNVAMERFRREALLLASVNHPNIATIHGVEEANGVRFLVLELVEGQSLEKLLRLGPLPVEEALRIGSQVARALEAAHKRGVIHRDLKPGNVMVGEDDWVKVLDFGVAKVLESEEPATGPEAQETAYELPPESGSIGTRTEDGMGETIAEFLAPGSRDDQPTPPVGPGSDGRSARRSHDPVGSGTDLTTAGTVVGTAAYISPEQIKGRPADSRADIWAFGCLLYECLAGRKAFRGRDARATFYAIRHSPPKWDELPPETPAAVRTLLGRCLQKDPNRRLHSIADARIELDEALHPFMAPQQPHPSSPSHPVSGFSGPPPRATGGAEGPSSISDSALSYLTNLGPYTVVDRLGAGGMGEVYRAWDRQHNREVALKVLRPELMEDKKARRRLRDEAEVLLQLDHPNIAGWYDYGTSGDHDYLVMEFVPGESLAAKLAAGPLPGPEVARLGAQVSRALAAAHDSGMVHRDLKAGNVLITPTGQAKVIDFGLARALSDRVDGAASEDDGPLAYRAPELLDGEKSDERSDLYSLGVVLYLMAAGRRPFAQEDAEQLTRAIRSQTPEPPSKHHPGLPQELDRLIVACLEKEPHRRPETARTVAESLEAMVPAPGTASGLNSASWGTSGNLTGSGTAQTGGLITGTQTIDNSSVLRRPLLLAGATGAAIVALALLLYTSFLDRGPGGDGRLAAVDSLVVMPTQILDTETDPYLADAIPNSLSTRLTRIAELETKVPPSSADVERVGGDLTKIAEAYEVAALVLSTASAQQGRLILNLQLVEAGSRNLLWSREYRGVSDAGYSELVQQAAEGLRLALRPEAVAVADDAGAVPGSAAARRAAQYVQRGLYYSNLYRNRGRPGDKERAMTAFQEALQIDPEQADAAAELATLHAASLATGVSILEVLPEIQRWADKALAIDPRSSRAWAVLGEIEGGRNAESFRKKLEYALRAASYGPRDGYAHGRLAAPLALDSPALALAAARRASEVDPLVLTSPLFEAILLSIQGRDEEAIGRVDDALEIEPGMPFGLMTRAIVLAQFDEEATLTVVEEELQPLAEQGLLPPLWVSLPRDFATFGLASRAGDQATADVAAGRLIAMARGENPFPRWQLGTANVPQQLARFGRPEEALDLLEFRADKEILPPYEALLLNSDLDPLRGDPRFVQVLAQARADFEATIAILEEARARGELPPYLEQPLATLLPQLREARQRQNAAASEAAGGP